MTKAGVVHYHVMVWLPKSLALPKPDKSRMWRHGMSQRVLAKKPVGYMAKYASKCSSKEGRFPRGMRLHGAGGLTQEARAEIRWWNLPKWARELAPVERAYELKRARVGGGVVHTVLDHETGEVLSHDTHKSDYERCMFLNMDGDRHVLFAAPGARSPVPAWLASWRSMGREVTKIVMPDAFASLKTYLAYMDKGRLAAENGTRSYATVTAGPKPWRETVRDNLEAKFETVDWTLPGWASGPMYCPF